MKRVIIFFIFFTISTVCLSAQDLKQNHKLSDDLVNFFIGNWSGSGEFHNGKKISANITFKMALDNKWLYHEHSDLPPNDYKAFSFWGIDKYTGEFVAYSLNNFQGHKKFSSNGWVDEKLILTNIRQYPEQGLVFEHFIYEKLTEKSFKMTYEISQNGINWKMIDYLVFNKR